MHGMFMFDMSRCHGIGCDKSTECARYLAVEFDKKHKDELPNYMSYIQEASCIRNGFSGFVKATKQEKKLAMQG